jgi:hypothetical protein
MSWRATKTVNEYPAVIVDADINQSDDRIHSAGINWGLWTHRISVHAESPQEALELAKFITGAINMRISQEATK